MFRIKNRKREFKYAKTPEQCRLNYLTEVRKRPLRVNSSPLSGRDLKWGRLADTPVMADPAHQGNRAIAPRNKPQGGDLSIGDKVNNRSIASIRFAVERCIAHLANWKILANGYRGRLAEHPTVIRIITSLELYRLC
ncbi:transposase family protein [Streptomyces chartreusis]